MKHFDAASEAITLDGASLQVADATPVTDPDGTRQAVLMFDPGTDAVMELPDGSTRPLNGSMDVRATEFTVGAAGDEAMPGELPPTSGYTYAVELSIDQAVDAGAATVTFDKPVASYVDNFLDFPAGTPVPAASYDRERGAWVPAANGVVIKILAEPGGVADIDADGDGLADSPPALGLLGIDLGERIKLAQLYNAGKSLWRVQVRHFTPWDYNWPYGLDDDAVRPSNPPEDPPPCPECQGGGSIIGFLNQSLGEEIHLLGTPFSLHYASDRTPGYREAYTLDIPVSGPSLPASLEGIQVEVTIGGRVITRSLGRVTNHVETIEWDGKDAYGRTLQGAQTATVRIGYTYKAVYMEPARFRTAFARFGREQISQDRARRQITLWQEWQRPIGSLRTTPEQGLGGWTISVHHSYDPVARSLTLGTGEQWTSDAIRPETRSVAGGGPNADDGVPATTARLKRMRGGALGADGTLYIADTESGRIRHVRKDGMIETVAGGGSPADGIGDGLPAKQAALVSPSDVDVAPDGSIFVTDTGNGRIRRVSPDGIIRTVAGGGNPGELGDDGPAVAAWLNRPRGLALAPDGTLFVADTFDNRVRRVSPDGTITTEAGGGTPASGVGDGGLATDASLSLPYDVAVDSNGELYIADGGHFRVRAVRGDGRIETVAGTGRFGYSGDGGPATAADFGDLQGIEVARDGAMYVADRAHHVVRKVSAQGIASTFAGDGAGGEEGEVGPPGQAQLSLPQDVAVGPDFAVYIADSGNGRVRRATTGLPGFQDADLAVPSQDGREVFLFTAEGRHLRTIDALTGTDLYRFEYDAQNRLTKVIDADGDTTQIVRAADGKPTKIVGPGGQETALTVDANGYLATVANPLGQLYGLQTSPSGLLTSFTTPAGGVSRFFYDTRGRLIKDENAADGFTSLARNEVGRTTTVTSTTALGRSTQYVVTRLPDGSTQRRIVDPSGAVTDSFTTPDGTTDATTPDGTKLHVETGPDPRWGMMAPLVTKVVNTAPSGRVQTTTRTRDVTLAVNSDPFSLLALDDISVTNGRTAKVHYDRASRTATTTTAAGRTSTAVFDARGRVVSRQLAPGVTPLLFTYDEHGRPKSVSEGPQQSQTFT